MELKFRPLNADEIDCRVAQVTEKGVALLLYKDARVDQKLLDEVVGPMNWKRDHQLIGDRLYCTVSVWNPELNQWISKQDVGVESNTEPEKGQASDSFKRACFNFGIGRELYTAPFIWIGTDGCTINDRNGRKVCYDRFEVLHIAYQDGKITELAIGNVRRNQTVFQMGIKDYGGKTERQEKKAANPKAQKPPVQSQNAPQAAKPIETINQPLMSTEAAQALWTKLTAANVNINKLLAKYKVRSIVSLNPAQVAEIERLLEEFWDGNNGNAESDHSGNGYVGAGFQEAV